MLSLLDDIDLLDASATGALVLGESEKPLGVVFVQHARVCWAVSSKMRGRLTDLLLRAGDGSFDRELLERLYAECRASRLPLGETLVHRGIVSAAAMREALLTHTCEALLACASGGRQDWRWQSHSEPSYDAASTFSAAEVLTGLSAVQAPAAAAKAQEVLGRHFPDAARGIVFVRESGGVPIALRACTLSASALVELGQWAASTVDIAGAINPDGLVVMRHGDESIVAWQHEELLYVALCADPSDTAFVVAAHTRHFRR
jgi:hypothetical protein